MRTRGGQTIFLTLFAPLKQNRKQIQKSLNAFPPLSSFRQPWMSPAALPATGKPPSPGSRQPRAPRLPWYFRGCFFSHYCFFFQAWHKILKSFMAFSSLICSDSFFEDHSASRWLPAPLLSEAVFPSPLIAFCTRSRAAPTYQPSRPPHGTSCHSQEKIMFLPCSGLPQAAAPPVTLQLVARAGVLQPDTRVTKLSVTGWQGAGCPGCW